VLCPNWNTFDVSGFLGSSTAADPKLKAGAGFCVLVSVGAEKLKGVELTLSVFVSVVGVEPNLKGDDSFEAVFPNANPPLTGAGSACFRFADGSSVFSAPKLKLGAALATSTGFTAGDPPKLKLGAAAAAGALETGATAPKLKVGAGFFSAGLLEVPVNFGLGVSQAGQFSTETSFEHMQPSQVYFEDLLAAELNIDDSEVVLGGSEVVVPKLNVGAGFAAGSPADRFFTAGEEELEAPKLKVGTGFSAGLLEFPLNFGFAVSHAGQISTVKSFEHMQPSQVYLLDLLDCPNMLESEGAELAGITVSLALGANEVLVV